VIVGAVSANSEHVGAEAREQDRLVPHVAGELRAIGELGESNSLREIGPGGPGLILGHFALLLDFVPCSAGRARPAFSET
jgi:hypothetical protein